MFERSDTNYLPADLGRRVAYRRKELGLSRQEVATRAGMAPDYIDYVERHHANLTAEALLSLAVALETSVGALLGAGAARPPVGRAGRQPRFERLEAGDCMRLISHGGIGRVVYTAEHGPEAVPVNFTMYEGAVVFRTMPNSVVAQQIGRVVGFEVDRLDEALSQGWSVLVSGTARRVVNPADVARIRGAVEPWAGDERHVYVVVDPSRITGRRIST